MEKTSDPIRLLIPVFSPATGTWGGLTRVLAVARAAESAGHQVAFVASGPLAGDLRKHGYPVYPAPASRLGYLFYAYGIYAIERVYNALYFLYLAIFGLSFYSIIYSVASIRQESLQQVELRDRIRKLAVGFSLFVAILFSILWIIMLIPLIQAGQRIEFTYSIFILDLSFIMPAFFILASMTAKKRGLGLVLTPALYVLGFTLLFPVGLGEFIKPFYDLPIDPFGVVLYLGIAALFLVLAVIYLRDLRISDTH